MAIYLSDSDVRSVIEMEDVLAVVEQAFRESATGQAINLARRQLNIPNGTYRMMSGAVPSLGAMCTKVGRHKWITQKSVGRSHDTIVLYSTDSGDLMAVILSDAVGDYRTGAMGGVATKFMARTDARTLGMLGSGRQARTQLMAIRLVRPLERVLVYSPNPEHRRRYCEEMSTLLDLEVMPVKDPREAVEPADIVVAATSAEDAVFDGHWLREGTHVITIRSSYRVDPALGKERREIDDLTVKRSDIIALDSREQTLLQQSPEIMPVVAQERVTELAQIVAGRRPGRTNDREITLFHSSGVGLVDAAAAAKVYQRAEERGLGLELPWP